MTSSILPKRDEKENLENCKWAKAGEKQSQFSVEAYKQSQTDTFLLIKQKSFSALQKGSASSSIPLSHPDVCPKTFVENCSPSTRGSAGRRAYKCSDYGKSGTWGTF